MMQIILGFDFFIFKTSNKLKLYKINYKNIDYFYRKWRSK